MKIYAIKQLSTGHYLPETKKGYSFNEPQPPSEKTNPRFFPSARAARCALVAWLRGHFDRKFDEETGGIISVGPIAQPHRIKSDYAVVALIATEEVTQ